MLGNSCIFPLARDICCRIDAFAGCRRRRRFGECDNQNHLVLCPLLDLYFLRRCLAFY